MKKTIILTACIIIAITSFAQVKKVEGLTNNAQVSKQQVKDSIDNNSILLSANDISTMSKKISDYLGDKLTHKEWDLVMQAVTVFGQQAVNEAIANRQKQKRN